MTLSQTTIQGNRAGRGGGIFSSVENGYSLTVIESTIEGNVALSRGGGVYTYSTVTITNTTISDNLGGEIYGDVTVPPIKASLTLNHVTLASSTPMNLNGSGIILVNDLNWGYAVMSAANSIFAGPAGEAVCDAYNASSVTSNGNNISTDASCHLLSFPLNGDQPSTDPKLGPLQDNGGPTFTRALLAGSPAVEHAAASATTHDQRGYAYKDLPDVGAYEAYLPPTIEVYNQYAPPFKVGDTTALYVSIANPDPLPFTHSQLTFTLTLPVNLVFASPVVSVVDPSNCGGSFDAQPGDRTGIFSGGAIGSATPGEICYLTLNVRGAAAGNGNVTATGVSSREAGIGDPPVPLVFDVSPGTLYLPLVVHP